MADEKVIGVYHIVGGRGLEILDILHDIDDYVVYRDMVGKKHKAKIYMTRKDRAYFRYGSRPIYLDECLRV